MRALSANWLRRRNGRKKSARRRLQMELMENRRMWAVYTVTNTGDEGGGTLRQAIEDANINAGPDQIVFSIPGAGPHTISPLSSFPDIVDTVSIDATTEPDFAGSPIVELDGTNAGASFALRLAPGSDGSEIRGLVINRFQDDAIYVESSSNTIAGNYVGTDITGLVAAGNSDGITLLNGASNNIIGGLTTADQNVLSGNADNGLTIADPGSSANQVLGNLIGLGVDGTSVVGNGAAGVSLTLGADGNFIGGDVAGARNIISGNVDGITITGPPTSNNVVPVSYTHLRAHET